MTRDECARSSTDYKRLHWHNKAVVSQPLPTPETKSDRRFLQLLLIAIGAWGATYARFLIGPLQEAVRISLGLTDNRMALLQGMAMAIPMVVGSIPFGLAADRFSRSRMLLLFAGLNLGASLLSALATDITLLFAARCLVGFSSSAILVGAYSLVADLYAPAERGRASMVITMGEIGGSPVAFALGGTLLGMSSSMLGVEGWRWSLGWASACLVPVLLLMFVLREPPRTERVVKNPALRTVWPQLWRYRAVAIPLLLARATVWIADGAVMVWGAPTLARDFHLSPERVGTLMGTVLFVSGLLGPLLGGPLVDFCQRRGGPRRVMLVLAALALVSAPMALFALAPNVTLAAILLGTFLTLGFVIGTAGMALATIAIPGEVRGFYLGITITAGSVFFVGLAPLMISGLSSLLGGEAAIGQSLSIICTAVSLLGAFVFAGTSRYFPRSTES